MRGPSGEKVVLLVDQVHIHQSTVFMQSWDPEIVFSLPEDLAQQVNRPLFI